MRFGLVPLEFGRITKQIMSGNIPDFSKFDITEHLRYALEIEHISVIEISADIQYIIPNSLSEQAIKRLNDLKDELGHTYTVHLPLWSLELASFNEPIRKGGIESIVDSIKLLEPLEPEVYVLHNTGP
ncbi:MAG: hypothetical protein KAR33_05515, partial [Candidatus Thorarchaeota archaeon]|nr:hypothetical protein [Candidatus Thorarchaeota archaeon]